MNILKLIFLSITLISGTAFAQKRNFYADVQVTEADSKSDFIWERENQHTPKYPIELARSGIMGCAVLSFNITELGKTENVEVINSIPNKHLGKYSRKMLKKWKWILASNAVDASSEKRTLRLDYCIGEDSTEQTQKMCKQQSQLTCASKV
ncbi:TonB family protein [uncultured Shewanella sp.]|uniref:TonB family protein n=1 Tax=uncultured Shewanella sp. TaxID=173975 RepID=UPI002605B585|nr:TonB family protein [uncultured Shewanella sp.]